VHVPARGARIPIHTHLSMPNTELYQKQSLSRRLVGDLHGTR